MDEGADRFAQDFGAQFVQMFQTLGPQRWLKSTISQMLAKMHMALYRIS